MVQESWIQEQHQPICLQNPQKPDISNIPTNLERNNNNNNKKWKALAIGKRIYKKNTIFVKYRQGSDGVAQVAFRWKHNLLKIDQDVLVFFNGGNRLKSESLLSKAWATEEEPRSNPSLNPKSCQPKPNSDHLWFPLEAHQMAKNGAQCHQGLGESNHLY